MDSGVTTQEWLNESADSLERDDRQVLTATEDAGFHSHSGAWAVTNQGPRLGTMVAARLRHIAGTRWGTKRYLDMERLREQEQEESLVAEEVIA
jgi:hypothetical protein